MMMQNTQTTPNRFNIGLRLWITLFSVAWLCAPVNASGTPTPPNELLKNTTSQMVDALNSHKKDIKADPLVVNKLVEDILLPHIDFISASKWVLGRHWRTATKEQKLEFIRQFRSLLLRFYSTALANYLNENGTTVSQDMFIYQPLRAEPGAKRVNVHSEIHTPSGKIVPIKYSMHLTKKGWKLYDVSVEGVSMVTTYRTSFDSEIKQKGLDGVIANLTEKNRQLKEGKTVSLQNSPQ